MPVRHLPWPAPYNTDPQTSADQEGETQEMDDGWRDACRRDALTVYTTHHAAGVVHTAAKLLPVEREKVCTFSVQMLIKVFPVCALLSPHRERQRWGECWVVGHTQKPGPAWDLWEMSPHPGNYTCFWVMRQQEGSCQMCILDFQAARL